jgi:molybdenum cofactor cytidylyltransferase
MPNPAHIAAIILAAGSSKRFGDGNKLLALIDGRPLVCHVIEAIEAAGIERIVIVTGHEPDKIAAATAQHGRRITYNERHTKGMGTSIATGVKALDGDVDGVLIAQGDMPAVDPDLMRALQLAFSAADADQIVHPVLSDGRQANPVLWPRRLFADLRKLAGDRGGKHLIEAEGAAVVRVPIGADDAHADIDTQVELAAYVATRSSQPR